MVIILLIKNLNLVVMMLLIKMLYSLKNEFMIRFMRLIEFLVMVIVNVNIKFSQLKIKSMVKY